MPYFFYVTKLPSSTGAKLRRELPDLESEVGQALLVQRTGTRGQQALRVLHVADGERAGGRGRELTLAMKAR